MAGIYIHIPFCTQKCSYCNFYSVANTTLKAPFLEALLAEIASRANEFQSEIVETIYFGGGTPSILAVTEVETILNQIRRFYTLGKSLEITMEANPDDLSEEYLLGLKNSGVNRLSIGVQSFDDSVLRQINRRHSSDDAICVIENALKLGFDNLSIDLIYGIPNQSDDQWVKNLQIADRYKIAHLSCYALTVEEKTLLHKQIEKGKVPAPAEEDVIRQFNLLMDFAEENGYQQYEISNFCRDGLVSKHNSAYWNGVPYLGFGPGAHSFATPVRRWNLSNVKDYIEGLKNNGCYFEEEFLSEEDRYNEYVMTSLRTSNGCNIEFVKSHFDQKYVNWLTRQLQKIEPTWIIEVSGRVALSRDGKLMTDYITRELFFEE
jgi:oxygen-independent coproporphyrinogen III oxidase